MSKIDLKNITNSFRDVHRVSMASWSVAHEIYPRDHGGPHVVTQDGYDPEDMKVIADEFIPGRSGKWLSFSYFFRMSVPERRAEFIFGTAAEVMAMMEGLPSKVAILRPGGELQSVPTPPESDEMAAAYEAGRRLARGSANQAE